MRGAWFVQASSASERYNCTWQFCLKHTPISHYQADVPDSQWLCVTKPDYGNNHKQYHGPAVVVHGIILCQSLQPTANPLRGLPAAELGR